MRIKEGFTLRPLLGGHIVVGEGLAQVNFDKIFALNESAAYLWEKVAGKEFTRDTLVQLLLDRYDVGAEEAADDVDKLLESWRTKGFVE